MVDELPPYYFLDPEGQRADAPTGAGRALKRKCLQIIPYANHLHQVPPPHLLRYTDNDNQVRYGSWVRIGRVEHRTVNGDPDAVVTAFMSTKSMIRLPNFAVLLDQPIVQHYN